MKKPEPDDKRKVFGMQSQMAYNVQVQVRCHKCGTDLKTYMEPPRTPPAKVGLAFNLREELNQFADVTLQAEPCPHCIRFAEVNFQPL